MKMTRIGSSCVKEAGGLNGSSLALTAALAALVCGIAGTSSAQTVGWWGFEGVPGQTAGIGTVFPNRVSPSQLPAEVYARYDGTASTDYQPVFDNPIFDGFYCMGDSTTAIESHSTLRFTNPYAESGRSQGCPVRIQDSNGALDLQTFTLEGWFKMEPTAGNPGWRALFSKGYGAKDGGGYAYTYALYVDDVFGRIRAYFTVRNGGNIQHLEAVQFPNDNILPSFRDGEWHYVSLVVNGAIQKAHLYYDFLANGSPNWYGGIDLGGELVYNSAEPLVIGGSNLAGWQFCGQVDEVRLSDVIINTADCVLKKRDAPDGTVIGHFPMEGDFKSTVWTSYWADPAVSAATGGETPTFTDREKEMVYCDKDGVRIGEEIDKKCLTLNKGRVQWNDPELLKACVDALTIEFFLNATTNDNENWASIVRAGYLENSTTYLPWNISYTFDTPGCDVSFRVDTPNHRNQFLAQASVPLDGKWHHLAMQVWRTTDGKTSFALHVDYEQRAEGTAYEWIVYPNGIHWGFGLSGTPFVGRIDEVRLTKGVIPVDDFMRLRSLPKGLIISYQ